MLFLLQNGPCICYFKKNLTGVLQTIIYNAGVFGSYFIHSL